MPDSGLISPASPDTTAIAAPAPQQPAAQPQPAQEPSQSLPPDLLKVHALQALMAGNPPAVSANLKKASDRDEAKLISKHKDVLTQAGFGFYRSLSGDLGVLFNSLYIHPQDLQAADKMGKLTQIAPDWDAVNHAVAKSGIHNPVLKARSVPNGLAAPTLQAPPQATAAIPPGQQPVPQAAPSAQRKAMQARLQNTQPGAPTSGPSPGLGRFLNQIQKPVV